jgi:hypothetical protein
VTFVADPPPPAGWSASDLAALARAFDGFVAGDAERMARQGAAALDELAEPFDSWQLKLALRAFDLRLANLALGAGAVRYRDLDDAARDRYLLGWGTSRFSQRRTTFQALKRLAIFLATPIRARGPRSTDAGRRWATDRVGKRRRPSPRPLESQPGTQSNRTLLRAPDGQCSGRCGSRHQRLRPLGSRPC